MPVEGATASVDVWTTAGPEGGMVEAITIAPGAPETVYVGTPAGVFRRVAGAATWTSASTGLTNRNVGALAVDPSAPATLFAATLSGVFKTTDGGSHWILVSTGLPPGGARTVAIDPHLTNTIYAGTSSGVFKSIDGGASWQSASSGLTPSNVTVNSLAIDPVNSSTLYAAAGTTVFKSVNGGANWFAAGSGLSANTTSLVTIDPQAPGTLFVTQRRPFSIPPFFSSITDIFKSTDAASTWTQVNAGGTDPVWSIVVDPSSSALVYAARANGVSRSVDGGATWHELSNDLASQEVLALAISPSSPLTLWAGTSQSGAFITLDAGAHWTPSNPGPIATTRIDAIVVDPTNRLVVYCSVPELGIFKSTNGGVTWTRSSSGLFLARFTRIAAIAIDPSMPSTLYAGSTEPARSGSFGRIYKSPDGGATLEPLA